MKLVIQTQYKENYGAHDWDGQGECPQYWKFKGGDTFVVKNTDNKDLVPTLRGLIEYSDDHQEEYILSAEVMEDDAVCCESWETPWDIYVEELGFYASRYVKASRRSSGPSRFSMGRCAGPGIVCPTARRTLPRGRPSA